MKYYIYPDLQFLQCQKYFFTHHGPVCIKKLFEEILKLKSSKVQNEEDNEWLKFIYNGYIISQNW